MAARRRTLKFYHVKALTNVSRPRARWPQDGDVVGVPSGRIGEVVDVPPRAGAGRAMVGVRLDPKKSPGDVKAISAKIAELRREGYNRAQAVRVAYEEFRVGKLNPRGERVKFLVNPGRKTRAQQGGRTMAKRKMPPRYKSGPKKGQFKPKGARRNPSRKRRTTTAKRRRTTTARKATSRSRTYRRNPRKPDLIQTFTDGVMGAGGVLVGKAATRSLPQLLGLPQGGNTGLAIQAATAVLVGFVADRFIGPDVASYMLAGGLSAPMENLVVRMQVPWLSTALSTGAVAGYVNRGAPPPRMGLNGTGVRGYVPARTGARPSGMYGYAMYN